MWVLSLVIAWIGLKLINLALPARYRVVVLGYKPISLGTLTTWELTIAEFKPLFSLKIFYFHPGVAQEIYHNHSFSAYSFRIFGNYYEKFIDPASGKEWELSRSRSRIIYIAPNKFHQITKSDGCMTVMLTGPWGDSYQEYQPQTKELITSTHGRKEVHRHTKEKTDLD